MTHDHQTSIHLDQFLKAQALVSTGGQAKQVIQGGEVHVNGKVETRRRRQLQRGDVVEFDGEEMVVEFDDDDDD
ncbi:ribosome-associated protein [Botrimarina colliarenosi]|uniref:Ribosome-associated protein n=1 Tax=Botrimarina colliarenosi TaxID=2528001 RepID=A0A5C6AI78_9BACT|nr:RNA-binding S4 domain-containing protein [Botrimarina colliarenosi]TWT97943.1 ribosome-associated protein [Botrimarina colliarenosi]